MSATSAPAFNAWLDDFLTSYYRRRPINATFIGLHDHDDRLPDLSEAGQAETRGDAEALLTRLHALPVELLAEAEALDRQLAEGFLLIQRWESGSAHFAWGNPSAFTGEAVFGVLGLLLQQRSPIARLAALPGFLDAAQDTLRSAPRAWVERARRECTGGQLLMARLDLPGASDAALAFARFDAWLEHDLLPRASDDYACGGEAFARLLRWGHFVEDGADELERLALERLAAEEAVIAAAAPAEVNLERQEPYLARFARVWDEARALAERRDLLTFPEWPVRYVDQPDWVRQAAPYLYFLPYRSPAPLDPPEVVEYFAPPGADDATIKLNHVVHHGSLGHHVQNWHAARATSRIGRIAAVDCASRIAMLCGGTLAEGWACYATDLADEAGFLTPGEQRVQHQTQLRMAARAVVDIRLHDGRFTLADAAAFYVERVGMSPAAAHGEAVKNSMYPGTACMYLAGWEGIRRLRRELRVGSLREFHDRFLSFGSVPVALVARAMLDRTPAEAHL